jgi:hypothetical protein
LGRWTRWWGYLFRWLVFGLVVNVLQPVADPQGNFWQQKLVQATIGVAFGFTCAVIFTLCENTFNTPRMAWKSWAILLASWVAGKVIFATGFALFG